MCYQTRLIRKREEIMERFNAAIDELSDFEPFELCNAFDFPKTPVITNEKPQKIQLFNWGYYYQSGDWYVKGICRLF